MAGSADELDELRLERSQSIRSSAFDAVFAPTFDTTPDSRGGDAGGFFLPGSTDTDPGPADGGRSSSLLSPPLPAAAAIVGPVTWKGVLAYVGPAFLVSVGYLDPGNWATDIEGGSRFGYQLLWVLLFSNAMALLLQTLAARMGIVTQSHLAELCRDEYPRWANGLLWFIAELAIIATDLTEVLGTAIGLNLVFKVPLVVAVVLTVLDTFVLLAVQNHGMRRLEQVMFVFLALISLCFMTEMVFAKPSVSQIAKGALIPIISRESLYIAVGMIGATVMPHNFYLHSAIVLNRGDAPHGDRNRDHIMSECKYALIDTALALNAALFINCAILIISAANFWAKGIDVRTLQKAHDLLEKTGVQWGPLDMAQLLFGLALIASGQSSTLTGTLAGQFVMEGFLDIRGPVIVRRLVTRLFAVVPAILAIISLGDAGTYQLLIYSQVILSLQLPFAIIPMIKFTGSKRRMGEFANSRIAHVCAWGTALLTVALNLWLVFSTLFDFVLDPELTAGPRLACLFIGLPICVVLILFLLYIIVRRERIPPDFIFAMDETVEDLITPETSPAIRPTRRRNDAMKAPERLDVGQSRIGLPRLLRTPRDIGGTDT